MSRGGSYGGGQSSLGYPFGSDDKKEASPPSPTVLNPPYAIDTEDLSKSPLPKKDKNALNDHQKSRAGERNVGNYITDRPSTRIKSVPGGDSSLGYLFGDK